MTFYPYTDALGNTDHFQSGCPSLTPISNVRVFRLPRTLTNTGRFHLLNLLRSDGHVVLSCYFNLQLLSIFSQLMSHLEILNCEVPAQTFCQYFSGLFVVWLLTVRLLIMCGKEMR